eukprot:Gb_26682 [translate_table: standard]
MGSYEVKRGVDLSQRELIEANSANKVWNNTWLPPINPSVACFFWMLMHKKFLTYDNLKKR